MTLEIAIDREVCMGSGNCSFWAPGVFDLDDDGVAIVIDPDGASEDKIVLAAQGCPTQAISLVKDGQKLAQVRLQPPMPELDGAPSRWVRAARTNLRRRMARSPIAFAMSGGEVRRGASRPACCGSSTTT